MKDLSVAKLKKLVDMLRERKVTHFKYKDIEFKLSYPTESTQILIEDDTKELTPEEQKKRDEALLNWSA